jgi:Domain of unknown function (DUF5069)
MLPRVLDKCRATLAGKNGEYHYDCPLDRRFLSFVGINADELKAEVEKGEGDGAILAWILKNSATQPNEMEIAAWSEFSTLRVPTDVESREFFTEQLKKHAPDREDIATWFDLLDVDDYVSYGGQA